MTHNNSLEFNEQSKTQIQPVNDSKPIEKYFNTPYFDAYQKGVLTAKMTLDVKNKDRIVHNLISVIFDDILMQNKDNNTCAELAKIYQQIIHLALAALKSNNFKIDVPRITCIIEGYGKQIEQENN